MDNTKTGFLIKKLRKEKGMTQKELADFLHITDRAVSKWERGLCAPDISLLEPLAEILGISIAELIEGKRDIQDDYIEKVVMTTKNIIDYSREEITRKVKILNRTHIIIAMVCFVAIAAIPILLYFFPNLTGQLSHFLDILLAGFAVGIGDLGKLVGVVAKPGYLVEQIRMVIAGPCPQFRTHDKGAEEFLTGQAACFHLRFQMGQFLFVQVEGDDVVSFSHGEAPFNALALSVSGFPSALTDENIHYCEFGCGNPYSENFQAILLKNENFPPDLPGEIYGLCTFQGRLDAVS